jgi:type II secretory pathway pseudopilin PulG
MQSSSEKGATLIEVLVAATLASFLLIAGIRLSGTSRKANILGRDLSGSAALLNSFIEEIHAVDVDSLPKNVVVLDTLTGGAIVTYKIFDQSSASPYRQPAGLALVNAKLNWTRWGRSHQLETSTLLTNQ